MDIGETLEALISVRGGEADDGLVQWGDLDKEISALQSEGDLVLEKGAIARRHHEGFLLLRAGF
jgi:hypothetical protein